MWPLLLPLLTGIFGENGPIGQYFKTKAAKEQAAVDLALQDEKDTMALSGIMAQAAVDSERNKLAATSQSFKAVSFFLLNVPIIITCLSDNRGKALWDNLSAVPVWYAQLYVSVVFVIWGLPVVANATGTIFGAIQDAWDARNQGKIAKIAALGQANGLNTEQATKQIFDIMHKTMGAISQAQVNVADPLIKSFINAAQTQTQPTQVNVNAPVEGGN
jgi:hypothetical protein